MKGTFAKLHIQIPSGEDSCSVALATYSDTHEWDSLRIAVAYASVGGLLHALDILKARHRAPFTSQWLIGLDDYLTQPGVLRTCRSLPGAELRTARLSNTGRRFHPKLMLVSKGNTKCLACVGSSNLTLGGLKNNCEAFATLQTASTPQVANFADAWTRLWELGSPATDKVIDDYEAEYIKRPITAFPSDFDVTSKSSDKPSATTSIIANDNTALDPALAQMCWIEVGKNTAKGHELEFKAEQALFFSLSPSGDVKQVRRFISSVGAEVELPFKYQDNGMWRLQMNSHIPEVATGLRPRDPVTGQLGRSPYVALFTRTARRDVYSFRFISDKGKEYRQLKRQSELSGSAGSTTSRNYGWC